MPLGNDLLVVGLTVRHHDRLPYYAVMAAIGSVLGCLVVDFVCRGIAQEKLDKLVSRKRIDYVHKKMEKRGGWVLAMAALMPPPFPFTPFLMAASTLEYPRVRLVSIIGATRLARFAIIGGLAVVFGQQIIGMAKTPTFEWTIGCFVAICIVGSVISVARWFMVARGGRKPTPAG